MGKKILCITIGAFFAIAVWASGTDKSLILGRPEDGKVEGWTAFLQSSERIVLIPGYKGRYDLSVAHASYKVSADTDLLLHFDSKAFKDETGNYEVRTEAALDLAIGAKALMGGGSLRSDGTSLINVIPGKRSLLSPECEIRDFSLEFWLNPVKLEEGETILRWIGTKKIGTEAIPQSIRCVVKGSGLLFMFENFFIGESQKTIKITLQSMKRLTPNSWSHHLVRFDSSIGLIEYLQDGEVEAVEYATSSGKEAGSIYLPSVGTKNTLQLCPSFSGMLDEFRISSSFIEKNSYDMYPLEGGRAESRIFDLGYKQSAVKSIRAISSIPARALILYFYRTSDAYGDWGKYGPEWKSFIPGASLPVAATGRYLQIAVELYPDPVKQVSPRLSELIISYSPDTPPASPQSLSAIAKDGSIDLAWSKVPESDVKGYYLYYGTRSGEYLGIGSSSGESPIDVGNVDTFSFKGLKNGVLYFITIAAYDNAGNIGPFSPEQAVRPVRMVE